MNLTTKLLSAVAATTLTAAALTFTTTTAAEAQPAGLADLCHSFGGTLEEDFHSWGCEFPFDLWPVAEPALIAACLDPTDPEGANGAIDYSDFDDHGYWVACEYF
jgi:hypothetical protein